MSNHQLRHCCRSRSSGLMLDPGLGRHPGAGPVVVDDLPALADLTPDPGTAWHEAAHTVVGIALNMFPEEVVAGQLGFVRFSTEAPTENAGLVVFMAGDHGALLRDRFEDRPPDAELIPYLDLVREPAGGGCDRCQILRALVRRHGLDAANAEVLADYRNLELKTLEILRDNRVRAAIRAVATALMVSGHLSGRAALEIVIQYLEPGEFLSPNGEHNEVS